MSHKSLTLIAGALGGIAALVLAAPLVSAQPAAPPAGRGPTPTPKPGYAPPPENAGGRYTINGEPIFNAKCAGCHDPAVGRAPSKRDLEQRTSEDVYAAMTTGPMKPMAEGLNENELYAVAYYLTRRTPVVQQVAGPDSNRCAKQKPLDLKAPVWNGWGVDVKNSRYQPNPGLTAADIPRLKVKWAFSYRGTKNSQSTIFGGRVFDASMGGMVYSLDAKTGCVYWRHDLKGATRATMTVAPLAAAPSKYALYFGDDRMVLHALDAGSGKELWNVKVDDHVLGRITGAPTLYRGVLYVPLASGEENMANQASYGCCTFRGTVVAVDAKDGHIVWKSRVTEEPARPTRKNSAGTQMYGPAGGAIWSSPTIDAKRGQLYVATGDSYTEVPLQTSDSVMAMDLKTGKIRWSTQVLADDNFMGRGLNVPLGKQGPDFDFGSSSHLITLPTGKDIVVTGNKSATVYGMDPDTGKIIWSNKIGGGGALGGVEFGSATDGRIVYTPLADAGANGRPGLVALNPADGKELWRVDAPKGVTCNVPSGRCGLGFSQAASAIPGAVFAGSQDGRLRAYSAAGKLLWEYETTQPIDTVNGVRGAVGGSLDFAGPTIAGGMVYVHSGYNGNAGPNSVLYAFSVDGK